MATLLVVGLPAQVRRRLEALWRGTPRLRAVEIVEGTKGQPKIIPMPDEAIAAVREEFDTVASPEELRVIVLPYAELPSGLTPELEAITSLGGTVVHAAAGTPPWPALTRTLDEKFLNALFEALRPEGRAPPVARLKPKAALAEAATRCPNLFIAPNAIDDADDVAPHRHDFFSACASALEKLADRAGDVGPLEEFFQKEGLNLATSGGIDASLSADLKGGPTFSVTTNHHLKQGDNTSRRAAVRLYFHAGAVHGRFVVVVLYAGPHPDRSVSRVMAWPP